MEPSTTRARFELELQPNTDSGYFIQLKMKNVSRQIWDNVFNSQFLTILYHILQTEHK